MPLRWFLILALMGTIGGAVRVSAGPIKGPMGAKVRIDEKSTRAFPLEFKGGERACIIVRGDHNPVVDLHLVVKDSRGNIVAEDGGHGDIVSAIWYPERDGTYLISVTNSGVQYNECYFVAK